MSRYYKLGGEDGHTPVLVGDFLEAVEAAIASRDAGDLLTTIEEFGPQSLRRSGTSDGGEISTIFLPYGSVAVGTPPRLFETAIVKPDGSMKDIFRHATWNEAMEFHEALIADFRTTMARARSDQDEALEEFMMLLRGYQ